MDSPQYQRQVSVKTIRLAYEIRNDVHDKAELQTLAYYLEYLMLYLPEERVEPAFEWIKRNGITGKKFLDFVQFDCQGSAMTLFTEITKRIEREKERRAILARDMRLV